MFTSLKNILDSEEFASFIESKLGNNLFINNHDRADRIHEAAEFGSDGSTHSEVIGDWRGFLKTLRVQDSDDPDDTGYDITQESYNLITREIDECEKYHDDHGTLFKQIG
jgi:hypothetical protein